MPSRRDRSQETEYIDPSRRANLERLAQAQKNISHKSFVSAAPGSEKGKHGGWEGTFAKIHGGYPHFDDYGPGGRTPRKFKNDRPSVVQPPTVRVGTVKKGGPGFPGLLIGPEPEYIGEGNAEEVEKLNRAMKLGLGAGFRSSEKKFHQPFWATVEHSGMFDPHIYQEQKPNSAPSNPEPSKAAQLARRADHQLSWNPACLEKKRPTDLFSRYEPASEPFLDKPTKELEKRLSRKYLPSINNRAFLPPRLVKDVLPCKSIAFYKHNR